MFALARVALAATGAVLLATNELAFASARLRVVWPLWFYPAAFLCLFDNITLPEEMRAISRQVRINIASVLPASSVGRACRELVPAAFFAPAAGDLSGFVYEEVFGAESYEASYGINFLAPSFRFVRFTI